ncbi:MAG: hypothetical protein AAGB93_13705 [Planctomycetota bacterium]
MIAPGDPVVGYASVVSTGGGLEFGFDASLLGARWIGVLPMADFRPLVTGNLLPSAFALRPNERYNTLDQVQVVGGDRWAAIAGTPAGLILRGGVLFVRDGDMADGEVLDGRFRGIAINRTGGLEWIGPIEAPAGSFAWAVFRERDLHFREGDTVDIDFDGVPDAARACRPWARPSCPRAGCACAAWTCRRGLELPVLVP